jgi:hypothetical protein
MYDEINKNRENIVMDDGSVCPHDKKYSSGVNRIAKRGSRVGYRASG